jgi:hypothetical protein
MGTKRCKGTSGDAPPCVKGTPGCAVEHFNGEARTGPLADLPRYLRVNGHRVIGDLAEEHLAKVANVRASLTAVLHQMEHGEASDSIDRHGEDVGSWQASADDLRWCREQIRESLKSIS